MEAQGELLNAISSDVEPRHSYHASLEFTFDDDESDTQLRDFCECAPIGIMVHKNEHIIYVNTKAMELMKATDKSDVIGRCIYDFVAREYEEISRQRYANSIPGGTIPGMRIKLLFGGGETYVESSCQHIYHNGNVATIVFFLDVTESVKTEREISYLLRQLSEQETKYRLIADNSNDLISILDASGVIQYVSPSYERILGFHISEYEHEVLFSKIHAEDVPYVMRWFDEIISRKAALSVEWRDAKSDGTYIHVEANGTPILSENGEVQRVLVVSRDISERKAKEHTLRAEKEKLDSMLENAQDAVNVMDLNGHVIRVNPTWETQYGWSQGEVLGKMNPIVLPERVDNEFRSLLNRVVSGVAIPKYEITVQRRDGKQLLVNSSFYPIKDASGQVIAVVGSTSDITDRKEAELKLKESEAKYRIITENSTDLIGVMDRLGVIRYASPSFGTVLGFEPSDLEGRVIFDVMQPLDVPQVMETYHEILREKEPKQVMFRFVHKDRTDVFVEANARPILNDNGAIERIIFAARDIRNRLEHQQLLLASEKRYRLIAENSSDIIRVINPDGIVTFASPSHKTVLGFEPEYCIGKSYLHQVHMDDVLVLKESFEKCFSTRTLFDCDYRNLTQDESYIWVNSTGTPVMDDKENIVEFVVVTRNINERKCHQQQLEFMAYHDSLTKLPNRRLFADRTEQALKEAKRHGYKMAVLYLDCDKFKRINDTYGHDVGDEVIKEFARRIIGNVRESDTVCRIGGDEFLVLLPIIEREEDATHTAIRIINSVSKPWEIDEYQFEMTTSIGAATYPKDAMDATMLVAHADEALYSAKQAGGNTFAFFETP